MTIQGLSVQAEQLVFFENHFCFDGVEANYYLASVAAGFVRNKLLETGISFTFETVMSSPDKIVFLQKAQELKSFLP